MAALEAAGHPVVRFEIGDLYEIFGQFFTWEIATAVAGSVMGINPFNQPDVESAKIETRALTTEYEKTGKLPERTPFLTGGRRAFALYATDAYAAKLKAPRRARRWPGFCTRISTNSVAGDYFATVAFLPMFEEHEAAIQSFRHKVRDKSAWPRAWASARAFCTPPGRTTRAARTPASFCRSPRTTPTTWIFPARSTALAW